MYPRFALCASLVLAAVSAAAQQPAPGTQRNPQTFRTGVEAVEIDVRVLDQRGDAVTGLTREDFEIFEDGVRQEIRVFSPVRVPFTARARALGRVESDVQSNRQPFDGRLYVIVLDDLHTHPLYANRMKRAVQRFMDEHLAVNDRAAIVVTSGRTDASQELTSSRTALMAALDRFQGRKLRSSTLKTFPLVATEMASQSIPSPRWLRHRQRERSRARLRAHRQGKQHLLRHRLPADACAA